MSLREKCLIVTGLFVALIYPAMVARAGVVVNEIAWMGTAGGTSGSYCEWIELMNTGTESMNLNGWTLSIGTTAKIFSDENGATLSIAPGNFYLIERLTPSACPDPVPGISADWSISFGSGIPNSGAIISITNASNVLIDRVDGSDNWKIGGGDTKGNNTTKETAQLSAFGWITATSTPRAKNVGVADVPVGGGAENNSNTTASSDSVISPTQSSNTTNWPVEPQVFANAGKDKVVIVGASTVFDGKALGLEKKPLENARFIWNFGDGATGEGKMVEHTYRHPGDYLVVMEVASGYFSGIDQLKVHAAPSPLSVSAITDGSGYFIELSNSSNTDIDISGWSLALNDKVFAIPKNTFVMAGKKLIFPNEVTGLSVSEGSVPELRYPNGTLASRFGEVKSKIVETVVVTTPTKSGMQTISASSVSGTKEAPVVKGIKVVNAEENNPTKENVATAIESLPKKSSTNYIWLLGVVGISVVALAGVIYARKLEGPSDEIQKLADEIEIIEG